MRDLKWIDVNKQKPDEGEAIFYLDDITSKYYEKNGYQVGMADIDKGTYVSMTFVEWHYDSPPDEFKYWFPIPRYIK